MANLKGPVLLYWGGKVIVSGAVRYDGGGAVRYDGGVTRLLKIPPYASYSELLTRIHFITGYMHGEYRLRLICKWLAYADVFLPVNIIDDESTSLMFDLSDKVDTIELYVEADRVLKHAAPANTKEPQKEGEYTSDDNEEQGPVTLDEASSADCFDERPLVIARTGKDVWLNKIFSSNEDLQQELQRWSLARHVQYKSSHSTGKIAFQCEHGNCKWSCHASVKKDYIGRPQWYISSYNEEHSCTYPYRFNNHRQCSSDFICCHIFPVFIQSFIMRVTEIMELVKSEFCIDISYREAYRARKKALKVLDGNMSHLPPLMRLLLVKRLGNANKRTDQQNEEPTEDVLSYIERIVRPRTR